MMAGSTCSNHRPDTLMQDHIPRSRNPLATHGRTIHLGQNWSFRAVYGTSASPPRVEVPHRPGQVGNRAPRRRGDRINVRSGQLWLHPLTAGFGTFATSSDASLKAAYGG